MILSITLCPSCTHILDLGQLKVRHRHRRRRRAVHLLQLLLCVLERLCVSIEDGCACILLHELVHHRCLLAVFKLLMGLKERSKEAMTRKSAE